jgi:hypothetical protein
MHQRDEDSIQETGQVGTRERVPFKSDEATPFLTYS